MFEISKTFHAFSGRIQTMAHEIRWESIDSQKQIWSVKYKVPGFISRSTALLGKDQRILLVGPGKPLVGNLPPAFQDRGDPTMALLPNAYHYMGVFAWLKQYPDLEVFASRGAMGRLKKKGCSQLQDLSKYADNLPENVTLLEPEGMGYGEVWHRVQRPDGVTWVICDAFFNHARLSKKPIARTLQKCLHAAPGLSMSSLVKHFLIKDRQRYKKWLFAQLEADQPNVLVPVHGEILRSDDVPQQIQDLVNRRL